MLPNSRPFLVCAVYRPPSAHAEWIDLFEKESSVSQTTGHGCSKLTTSLVNVSLKFQTLISEICQYILLKKCEKLLHCKSFSHFFNKNISVFGYKVIKHLTS